MEKGEKAPSPFKTCVPTLTQSLLKIYEPNLKKTQSQLDELTAKQRSSIEQIHEENLKISEIQHSKELQDIFGKIESYQVKLVNIKKNMKHLHEKTIKLKKRALKVEQVKNKQDYLKNKKEHDLKLEEELIGKPT